MDFNSYEIDLLGPCKEKEESVSPRITNFYQLDIVTSQPCAKPDWEGLRQLKLFCDGIIVSDDGSRIPVHKALLAGYSSFFRAAFSPPLGSDVVHLKCSTDVLNTILDFIYAGSCNLTECSAKEVLIVADMYCLENLSKYCCYVLLHKLKPENCVAMHKLAQYLSCRLLEDISLGYILSNFEVVYKLSEELYGLDAESLDEYLRSDMLNIRSEHMIAELVDKWVAKEPEPRIALKNKLLRHMRVRSSSPELMMMVEDRLWPRVPLQVIFTIGGYEDENTVSGIMETFDPRSKIWLDWEYHRHDYRAYHGIAAVDEFIYIVGGFDGSNFLSSVRKYDPLGHFWTDVSRMEVARCFVSVVALDGFIYAIGGRTDNDIRLYTCERFDVSQNQWHYMPSMNFQRSDAAAAVFNGKIFVAGGYNGVDVLSSVEMYDPETMRWTLFIDLPSPRSGLQLVTFQDRLYALGGYDGNERLDCVDSISYNSFGWQEEQNLLTSRSNFAAVSFEDRIWVIGGYGQDIGTLNETESFGAEGWQMEQSLSHERSCLAAIVLSNMADPTLYSSKYWHENYPDPFELVEMEGPYSMEEETFSENY